MQRLRNKARWLARRIVYGRGPLILSRLRQRWIAFRHPHATIRFGQDVYIGPGFTVDIPGSGTLIVGDGVEFRRGCRVEIGGEGKVEIGAGSYLTYGVLLACSTSISIGERCGIGFNSAVYDANHRYRDLTKPFLDQGFDHFTIRIEDDAQIHGLCTILADVGHRAIIGANAVVTKPVPPFTVAVGAPARPIEYFGPPT
jgi:galactoside O-acetyltransferase